MRNTAALEPGLNLSTVQPYAEQSGSDSSEVVLPFQSRMARALAPDRRNCRQLVSTKELSEIWGVPESTLRYWRSAETGPAYVKLGGRIKYDLADVERYVRANKRMPSVRAHGG
jgi:Helix-turn-helix domain